MKDVNVFDVFRRLERRTGDGMGPRVKDEAAADDKFGAWTVVPLVVSPFGWRLSGWSATGGRVSQRCNGLIWEWRVG